MDLPVAAARLTVVVQVAAVGLVPAIVPDDDRDRYFVAGRGPERLHAELEAAVSDQGHDLPCRARRSLRRWPRRTPQPRHPPLVGNIRRPCVVG